MRYFFHDLTNYFHKVHGSRFTEKYLLARQTANRNLYSYPYSPHPPARSTSEKMYSTMVPSSPPASSSSPPRKVVTDFAAFGAPKNASVFGTAVASTPFSLAGGKAAFGGMRTGPGRSMFDGDDDEEDDEDGKQRVLLKEDTISLDQVGSCCDLHCLMVLISIQARRIAMQSAWRNVRG